MKGMSYLYRPQVGEDVWLSPPGSENETGHIFQIYEVLWFDNEFVLYRAPDCWPRLNKWIDIGIEPLKPEGE